MDAEAKSTTGQIEVVYMITTLLNAGAWLFFMIASIRATAVSDCTGCTLAGAGIGATTILAVLMPQIYRLVIDRKALCAEATAVLSVAERLKTQHSNLKIYAGGAIDELSKYNPAMAEALTADIRLTACSDFGYR